MFIKLKNILVMLGFLQNISGLPLLQKNPNLKNPFIGFYVFPHGGVILDPQGTDYSEEPAFKENSKQKAIALNEAMQQAAHNLIQAKPDLIIFSTPHGFHLEDGNLILSTSTVSGTAGGRWSDFTASFDLNMKLSSILYTELKNGAQDDVNLMSLGIGREIMPLLWAEVIPWHFIREAAQKEKYEIPRAIYIGQPSHVNIEHIRNLGRDISKAALLRKEFTKKRIAVVISGDLSHYHSNDSSSPYPYSPISTVFDSHIVDWAKMDRTAETEGVSSNELFEKAGKIENQAGHCGYTGLVMLHGMMEELVNQNWMYKSHFYAYEVPTYFGMTVASWLPA